MTRADRVLSTPPLNSSSNNVAVSTTEGVDSTRRAFLARAAAVAAGGAALGIALPLSGSAAAAGQAPDPILEAIETHKAANAKFLEWVRFHNKLESELPEEKRRSDINAWETKIVESDDGRWIEAERQVDLTGDAERNAAWALLEVTPTTRAGILALLVHADVHDVDGFSWPDDWHRSLIEILAEELPKLWREEGATA